MDNPKKQPRKLWRVVMVLSLALNIAVIGAVVGLAISGRGHDGPPQRLMFDFGPLSRALEPADRREIGNQIRKSGTKPYDRDERNSKVIDLANALRQMPFDLDLVAEELNSFHARSEKVQQDAQAAFLEHLASMSSDARMQLADRLESGARR